MNLLEKARLEIDAIDKEMAELFVKRMTAVEDVISYKKSNNLPILDTGREDEVIAKNIARLPLDSQKLESYYKQFIIDTMKISRSYQAKLVGQDQVGYQGVPGAFSHIALKTAFPMSKAKAYFSWEEVFHAVLNDEISFGVLPFENSHAGDVSEVLDLCFANEAINITEMFDIPVNQNLLAVDGANLSDIKTVVSHTQALRQSAKFIDTIGAEKIEYPNTAVAAQYVANTNDKSVAAIASLETAELYNLEVLAKNINDSGDNRTRFVVISKNKQKSGNRFCLLFTVPHTAGSLAQVIEVIAKEGYNMESIKSRPMPHISWEYYFYTELVGNADESQHLIDALNEICRSVRILGTYNREN